VDLGGGHWARAFPSEAQNKEKLPKMFNDWDGFW